MAELLITPSRAADPDNASYSGAVWRFYEMGTLTPLAVYADADLTTSLGTSVTADAGGKFPSIYLDSTVLYRAVLKDASGSETIYDFDPVNKSIAADLAENGGADLIGTSDGSTVQAAIDLQKSLSRYAVTADYAMRIGYDYSELMPAAIKIGGNSAFTGTEGVLQIGGAGPKDGGNGSYLGNVGHPNWPTFQSSIARNPTELAIYPNGTTGVGTSTGTTTFTSTEGTFTAADVGRAIWLNGSSYTINGFTDATHVVLNSAPGAGTYVWHIVYTTGSGTCTVSGSTVTRVTGDPFIPHTFGSFVLKLNGVAKTVTATNAPDEYTISSPPTAGTYDYTYETNINDQLATLRIGPLFPSLSEENVTLMARTMRYELRTLYAGQGTYRDFILGSGESSGGVLAEQVTLGADGTLTLQKTGSKAVILGGPTASDKHLNVSRAAGYFCGIRVQTNFLDRFVFGCNDTAEGGANAGSDFTLSAFNDAGAFLSNPLVITRSTGLASFLKLGMQGALVSAVNDAAAAGAGVLLYEFYRNGSAVQQRVS